jgi:hypothetical protein
MPTFPWYVVVAIAIVAWHWSAQKTYSDLAAAGFINGQLPAGAQAASAGLLATGTAAGLTVTVGTN